MKRLKNKQTEKNSNYLTARKPHEICSGTSIDVHQLNLIMGNNNKNKTTTAAATIAARAKKCENCYNIHCINAHFACDPMVINFVSLMFSVFT